MFIAGLHVEIPNNDWELKVDDIKIEYHPKSGCQYVIQCFQDYEFSSTPKKSVVIDDEPWKPFCTQLDFEFAELALQAALSKGQINAFIKLIHHCAEQVEKLTLKNSDDLEDVWENASTRMTPVSCLAVSRYRAYISHSSRKRLSKCRTSKKSLNSRSFISHSGIGCLIS